MDLLKPFNGQKKQLENKEESVLVNPSLRFTYTTDCFVKFFGFKGKGS